jgi:hypothetical protein
LKTEGCRSETGDTAKGAGKVALVREAGEEGDLGEGEIKIGKKPAGGADAEAAGVFAEAFVLEAAEDAGEMDGMDTSFGAESVERELARVFGVELFENAQEPSRRLIALFKSKACGEAS